MSDEEKKAIEKIKSFNQYNWEMNNLKEKEFVKPYFDALDTILNLIEKQQKEIEELKVNNGYHLGFIDGGIAKKYEYQDKIKAKIEEVDYKMIGHQDLREAVKQVLNSLLEKE